MEIATASVFRWHVFTGSLAQLFVVTLVMTVPLAWALHRVTRPTVLRGEVAGAVAVSLEPTG